MGQTNDVLLNDGPTPMDHFENHLEDLQYTDLESIRQYILQNELQKQVESERTSNMFLIINGCTVLFMQCGFALLEAGAVRSKNVTNILLKNFLDILIGIIVYWAFGFAFAYGKVVHHDTEPPTYSSANRFIGHTHFFLIGTELGHEHVPDYPERVVHYGSFHGEFFFNFVFAATATTITSGALAERSQMMAYFLYSIFLTGFIQPVTVHWTWSNGFLLYPPKHLFLPPEVYFRDYAGGCNVHAVGGISALIGCIFIGPRIGRFDDVKAHHIPGHSTPLTGLGGFILLTGFLGMVLGHSNNIELSATNIVLGGATAGLTSMLATWAIPHFKKIKADWMKQKIAAQQQHWSFLILVDSTLCGMVALCSGCNIIPTYGAVIIGILAALTYLLLEHVMLKWQLDDPLGGFAVHFGGGLVGIIMTPFFMSKQYSGLDGIFYWEGCDVDIAIGLEGWEDGTCLYSPFYQLAWHLVGLLCIVVWTGVFSIVTFGLLWYTDMLRVDRDLEIRGIDIKVHGEPAYPNAAYGHGWDNEGDFALDVLDVAEGNTISQHHRRNVKALINPHEKENWKNSIKKGGLIEMAIAEQQKTFNMFTNVVKTPEEQISEANTAAVNAIFPVGSLVPILESGLGTGCHKEKLSNMALINSAKRPSLPTTSKFIFQNSTQFTSSNI